MPRFGSLSIALLMLLVLMPGEVFGGDPSEQAWIPVPFRVRDMTFPTVLVMGWMPRPTDSIGPGSWGFEFNYSQSNNFQISSNVERYLAEREGDRRPLDQNDVDFIVNQVEGDRFYFDGEFGLSELGFHYGINEHLNVAVRLGYLTLGGGFMDGTIYDFHDSIGIGQAGRDFVVPGRFQLLYIDQNESFVQLERSSSGGFTDPVFTVNYTIPRTWRQWTFAVEGGFKLPLADQEKLLGSGSFDFGLQLSAQRVWTRQALVLNVGLVVPGKFEQSQNFDPPTLPSINVAYMARFSDRVTGVAQCLLADNIWREATGSDLADPEFQVTLGVQIETWGGLLGLAVTENLFNFDNTPDLGVHLSFGFLLSRVRD